MADFKENGVGKHFERGLKGFSTDEKFIWNKNKRIGNFSKQYANCYNERLFKMRPNLEKLVKEYWRNVPVKKVAELCEKDVETTTSPIKKERVEDETSEFRSHAQHVFVRQNASVAIIGTIFKQQSEKPSILREFDDENQMLPKVGKKKYISESDFLILEDETTKANLILREDCGISVAKCVNGLVCALKGFPNIKGQFEVHEAIFPSLISPEWPISSSSIAMIFISGLSLCYSDPKYDMAVDLLFDFLEGLTGNENEQKVMGKQGAVFILGDSIGYERNSLESSVMQKKDIENRCKAALKLDRILSQLCRTIDVFLLPSLNDPAESMLPQPAFNRMIFPISSNLKTFHSLRNPCDVEIPIDGENMKKSVNILLCSGENVNDCVRNTDGESNIEVSKRLLEWGHICPTAPDTLSLHPGLEDDIFILEKLPHIFVVGNQPSFEAIEYKTTKVINVPKFKDTFQIVQMSNDYVVSVIDFNMSL